MIPTPTHPSKHINYTTHHHSDTTTITILMIVQLGNNINLRMIEYNPLNTHNTLYQKYAGSQTYFYSNKINEITTEKRTTSNIFY